MRMPADLPRRRPRGDRSGRMPRGRALLVILAVALFLLLTSLRGIAGFYTDFLWFDSLGYRSVLTGVLGAKISLAVIFSAGFFVLLWVNLLIADRLAPRLRPAGPEEEVLERYRELIGGRTGLVRVAISAVFGLIAGVGVSGQWNAWLLFTNAKDFGIDDPQFGMDAGFYVFRLPFLTYVVDWLFASLTIILIVTAVAHYVNGGIRVQGIAQRVTPQVKAHLSVLLALIATLKAADYYLHRFELTLSTRGAVDGATYTDVQAQLPAMHLLIFIVLVAVVLFIVNIWRRGWVLPVLAVGLWAFVTVVVGTIYPAFIQRFRVEPSESSKERPYIERNIDATRFALGLDDVETTRFAASNDLDAADLEANATTIRNIRLWDPEAITDAFDQLQRIRRQYAIRDVDVDRYIVDGELTQVLLSARELNTPDIPRTSWEARHLTYTNGHGVIVAASNAKDDSGRPRFLASDVPMDAADPAFEVEESSIYIGEDQGGYVIVDTDRAEIDYEDEDGTVSTRYDGEDGVGIGGYLRRAAFALRFGDINPLVSGNIRPESKILLIRDVRDRVELVAPFLSFDSDPYPVIVDGDLKWIIDGYTTTSRFPYAQRAETGELPERSGLQQRFNYVRNAVKAVVDAYDGDVTLYVVDDEDPLIEAYQSAFPELFTDGDEVPDELRDHFRYPEDLFRTQTTMWGRYHVLDADEFYTNVDAWDVSREPTGGSSSAAVPATTTTANGVPPVATRRDRIDPYYLLMQLPGEEREEFLLMRPFSPGSAGQQENTLLTAFMVATTDGRLRTYEMPRGALPLGPENIASAMTTDEQVSDLQTRLGLSGSNVFFGNLVLVPIEESLLYVRPFYVEPEGQSRIPELRKVVAYFDGDVAIEDTLAQALTALFGDAPETGEDVGEAIDPGGEDGEPAEDELDIDELLARAAQALADADAALADGDLGEYQAKVEEAAALVAEAQASRGGGTTTTSAPPADDEEGAASG